MAVARIPKVVLNAAALSRADLSGVDLSNANLSPVGAFDVRHTASGGRIEVANITNSDLSFATLVDAKLSNANAVGVNFRNANLTDANLTDANLSVADLTDANLTSANLTGAVLTNANLTDAVLNNANLTGARLNVAKGGLTQKQLDWACGESVMGLDPALTLGLATIAMAVAAVMLSAPELLDWHPRIVRAPDPRQGELLGRHVVRTNRI